MIRGFDRKSAVFFVSTSSRADVTPVIRHLRDDAEGPDKLVGCRVLVVGMPNIGKSTLINHLRNFGVGKAKALKTGGQPGITRKIASPVKIIERESGSHVYVLDTPGVFMPYVPDADNMLKLALCGCVKPASLGRTPSVALSSVDALTPAPYEAESDGDITLASDDVLFPFAFSAITPYPSHPARRKRVERAERRLERLTQSGLSKMCSSDEEDPVQKPSADCTLDVSDGSERKECDDWDPFGDEAEL